MSPGRITITPSLEKLKAGLGAAGMAAVGLEGLTSYRIIGEIFGVFATSIPFIGALLSAVVAAYFARVSETEVELEIKAGREKVLSEPYFDA